MKKLIAGASAVALSLCLFGCGAGNAESDAAVDEAQTEDQLAQGEGSADDPEEQTENQEAISDELDDNEAAASDADMDAIGEMDASQAEDAVQESEGA